MAQDKRGCLGFLFPPRGVNRETLALETSAEKPAPTFPYRPRKSLLSPAELAFYSVLKMAAGDQVSIGWTDSSGSQHTAKATLITGPAD